MVAYFSLFRNRKLAAQRVDVCLFTVAHECVIARTSIAFPLLWGQSCSLCEQEAGPAWAELKCVTVSSCVHAFNSIDGAVTGSEWLC